MKYTEKLGLKKPDLTDYVNIEDLNENMDTLDGEVGELKEGSTVIEDLQTENKTLAGAINEIDNKVNAHKADYATFKNNTNSEIIEIKNRIGVIEDILSWEMVQNIVRSGRANEYFDIGDQLVSAYDGGEIIWEVIGIDVDTPANSDYSHSMTIQTKDCLHSIQFDAPEPSNPDSSRQTYGNNRYIHSAVKQWLNSNESKFNWVSQHQYDTPPTGSLDLYNGAGFLYRLGPELVAVLGAVNKRVARNTVTDGGGQDSFSDKVFLLSRVEVGFSTEGDTTGEFIYPYYNNIDNARRIKALDGSPRIWWLRSPHVSDSYSVRSVFSSGVDHYNDARHTYGVSPACVII